VIPSLTEKLTAGKYMERGSEIRPLTGLRAVAALLVFLFHMQIRWPYVHGKFASNFIGNGAVGMSIFFVLSGFVLAYQYSGKHFTYRGYLLNRVARIYPVYLTAAILTLPWIGIHIGAQDPFRDLAKVILLVVTNILVIQAWFPQFIAFWNDGASWSISVEAFCYLLLPFFLQIATRLSGRQLSIVALSAFVLGVVPGLTYELFDNSPPIFYAMPIFRLPEFVLGITVFFAAKRKIRGGVGVVALALFVIATYILARTTPNSHSIYVTNNWIVLPAIAGAILFFANSHSLFAKLMGSSPVVWLGKISYCIYSFQILIIVSLISHHDSITEAIPILSNNRVLFASALVGLIAISGVAHRVIEEPMRRYIKRRWGELEQRPVSPGMGATHW
jgi:peptidoglycan/LPS O-acetylase OafA/YrhL